MVPGDGIGPNVCPCISNGWPRHETNTSGQGSSHAFSKVLAQSTDRLLQDDSGLYSQVYLLLMALFLLDPYG